MKHRPRCIARPLRVYLDEAELRSLEAWSRRRGWTKSQAVRAAIRAVVTRQGDDPLIGLSGMVEGLPPDASVSMDKYLEEAFVAPKPGARGPVDTGPRRAFVDSSDWIALIRRGSAIPLRRRAAAVGVRLARMRRRFNELSESGDESGDWFDTSG